MTEPIPIDINDLTFGIELEVVLPHNNNDAAGRDALSAAMVTAGLEARHDSLTHRAAPYWRITTDSTIGYENAEIVSPSRGDGLMRGSAGLASLRKAVEVISAFGATVDRNCGLHCHVGVRGTSFERLGFFKELVRTYAKFEPVLDQLVAPSRRANNNSMCRPVEYPSDAETATNTTQFLNIFGINQNNDRQYSKLNLGAYLRHGTVEFRQHQGTTNIEKIEKWVTLCQRMVIHAAKNTEVDGTREFVPQARPQLPAPPQFDPLPPDITLATPLTADDIPRFVRSNYWSLSRIIIRSVTNNHRPGTTNWEAVDRLRRHGSVNRSLWHCRGVLEYAGYSAGNWIRDLVRRGNVVIVSVVNCPQTVANSDEVERRRALMDDYHTMVENIESSHRRNTIEARTAWEAANSTATVSRPETDSVSTTLNGLLTLVAATPAEQAYFIERQMELNT